MKEDNFLTGKKGIELFLLVKKEFPKHANQIFETIDHSKNYGLLKLIDEISEVEGRIVMPYVGSNHYKVDQQSLQTVKLVLKEREILRKSINSGDYIGLCEFHQVSANNVDYLNRVSLLGIVYDICQEYLPSKGLSFRDANTIREFIDVFYQLWVPEYVLHEKGPFFNVRSQRFQNLPSSLFEVVRYEWLTLDGINGLYTDIAEEKNSTALAKTVLNPLRGLLKMEEELRKGFFALHIKRLLPKEYGHEKMSTYDVPFPGVSL